MKIRSRIVAIVAAASLAVSACATTGSGEPLTVEQKIARCAGMVLVGALVGTLAGGDDRRNAAIGAGLGGAACAVWLAFENQRDRERIAQMQLAAASTGQTQAQRWIGEGQDTRQRDVTVAASTQTEMVLPGAQERRICRTLNTTASVDGRSDSMSEVWCRGSDGNWAAAPNATPVA